MADGGYRRRNFAFSKARVTLTNTHPACLLTSSNSFIRQQTENPKTPNPKILKPSSQFIQVDLKMIAPPPKESRNIIPATRKMTDTTIDLHWDMEKSV